MVARSLGMAVATFPVVVVVFDAETAVAGGLEKGVSVLGPLDRVGWP